ncbi:sugar phosphate isomerase/epimerase [Thalassotalea sp. G20_0]|uniref:sugar phosphate isomerase/epimerase family protein n=1 Tax=Thalassotalea sp. G20_0 TaxID=2821093 RepID=UPI001ADB82A4|nr:sugar phosphate isomerase/epimerase family protein [Thalassotalea sp. G20_0]MBO9493565.1 sugar phosphate isomerase/epimerase [Thalassotalea sp. G20_0]
MEIGISNIAWDDVNEELVLDYLKNNQVQNIEVAPAKIVKNVESFKEKEVMRYKNKMNNEGFNVCSMQALLYGGPKGNIFGDNSEREDLKLHLFKIIEMAAILNAENLVFGSPKNRIKGCLNKAESFRVAEDFFSPIAEYASQNGCNFCIENNPEYYGADFLVTTSELVEFIRYVNHKGLKAHFDTAGMYLADEEIEESILQNDSMITHFHISQKDLNVICEGEINHKKVFKALKSVGYDKKVIVEMKKTESPVDDIKKAIDYVKKVYSV